MTTLKDPTFRPAFSPKFLHDLRTPLNQIIGYSEILVEQAQDEGQTGFVPDLRKIRAAGRQLLGMLNGATAVAQEIASEEIAPLESEEAESPSFMACEALILVVDDHKMNRDVLARRLEKQGYKTVMAENGLAAMHLAREQKFDLVLLDIMMPEMDGYEVLRVLKADPALSHIPVIMISALGELDSVVRCIEMGAEDYLTKPFEPTLLKARIGACLEKKRAYDREANLFEQLGQSYERLQELEQSRDDLTHMIIHDLHTPLSSVISGMQTVEALGELNVGQREVMDIALEGGSTLLQLIDGLLDVDKLETVPMELDCILLDANELIGSAAEQVSRIAESREVVLVRHVDGATPAFEGDETSLRRTLVNLLSNAIKFTPDRGTVTFGARPSESKSTVEFYVVDSGEGIPSEFLDQVFAGSGRIEVPRIGRATSAGLGLTYCRMAVHAHGGSIRVDSPLGRGCAFTFEIPLSQ